MKIAVAALLFATALNLVEVEATYSMPIHTRRSPKSLRDSIRDSTLRTRNRFAKAAARSSGSSSDVPLADYLDGTYYTAHITLGNNQSFSLCLDTGSADVWFRGPKCNSADGSCGKHGQPTVDLSDKTLLAQGFTWSTGYYFGDVSGNVYSGPIQLGNAHVSSLQFGVATNMDGYSRPGIDGFLGLGFSSISQIAASGGKNTNFIDALNLSNNMFAFYLPNSQVDDDAGDFALGGYNSAYFTGDLQYVPLNDETYWQFSLSGATYSVTGSISVSGDLVTSISNGIVETGVWLVILEAPAADAINHAIGSSPYQSEFGYPIDCSIINTGPDVVFTINGIKLTVSATQYVINIGTKSTPQCLSGITQGAAEPGIQIFGLTFLQAIYTVYDKANKQLGFAPANHQHNFASEMKH